MFDTTLRHDAPLGKLHHVDPAFDENDIFHSSRRGQIPYLRDTGFGPSGFGSGGIVYQDRKT